MANRLVSIVLGLIFFISLGAAVNAYYYDYYFESRGPYYSYSYPSIQGDPSYLRYDPYAYTIDPYPTGSIPSYYSNYYDYPYSYYSNYRNSYYYSSRSYPVYGGGYARSAYASIYPGYDYVYPTYDYQVDCYTNCYYS